MPTQHPAPRHAVRRNKHTVHHGARARLPVRTLQFGAGVTSKREKRSRSPERKPKAAPSRADCSSIGREAEGDAELCDCGRRGPDVEAKRDRPSLRPLLEGACDGRSVGVNGRPSHAECAGDGHLRPRQPGRPWVDPWPVRWVTPTSVLKGHTGCLSGGSSRVHAEALRSCHRSTEDRQQRRASGQRAPGAHAASCGPCLSEARDPRPRPTSFPAVCRLSAPHTVFGSTLGVLSFFLSFLYLKEFNGSFR